MIDLEKKLSEVPYHPLSEQLVDVLCEKTQNNNRSLFRNVVAYHFAKIASMMRTSIATKDRGKIPINLYVINLATSGQGKGHSNNIIEEEVINQFRDEFLETTFPLMATQQCARIANKRAIRKSSDPDDELQRTEKEFERLGPLLFSFDSGTPAAVKQMRQKLLMANAGSVNMEIDEIGSNLLSQAEVLSTFLELYDMGKVKQKLIKNTAENFRHEDINGRTPTNMMLYGTPTKLLNGGKVEEEFYSMLETGYARRCLFSYSREYSRNLDMTAEQIYQQMLNKTSNTFLEDLSDQLATLADVGNFDRALDMEEEVSILLIRYKMQCEKAAEALPEHEEIKATELSHRYFKALKLAGTYAFIDNAAKVTEDHLYQAIKVVEDSGEALNQLLTRDKSFVKLAKFITECRREITQADLVEELPCYKGTNAQKQELMTLATAWAYRNNRLIKKSYVDGIEFLSGESMEITDMDALRFSYSQDMALGYLDAKKGMDGLQKLVKAPGYHWCTHQFKGGHRKAENAVPGFNLVVLDVDKNGDLETAKLLLKDYTYLIYTTKSHTDKEHRFRIVLPTNFVVKLTPEEHKEFMSNLFEWVPFDCDEGAKDICRKWLSNPNAEVYINDGEPLDVLRFIPKTQKNEQHKQQMLDNQSLNNLERWFVSNTGTGNRNQQIIRYALMLVDQGQKYDQIQNAVLALNAKLANKLDDAEIMTTIMVSVGKAIADRQK